MSYRKVQLDTAQEPLRMAAIILLTHFPLPVPRFPYLREPDHAKPFPTGSPKAIAKITSLSQKTDFRESSEEREKDDDFANGQKKGSPSSRI